MSEPYYSGYTQLISYLYEHTEWSYPEFLNLHRNIILSSQPFSSEWHVLDLTWTRRFLKQAKRLRPDDYEAIEKQTRSIGCHSNPSDSDGSSCLLSSRLEYWLSFQTSLLRLVKYQCANKGLRIYWEGIIYEREKMKAMRAHMIGSMKVYSKIAESIAFPLQSGHQKNEAVDEVDVNSSREKACIQETIAVAENSPFLVSDYDEDEVLLRMCLVIKVQTLTEYACTQEVLAEDIKLPTPHKRRNEIEGYVSREKAKKEVESTPNTKNPRSTNDSEESFSSDVELKDEEEIKFDFTDIERVLQLEPINEWVVDNINVSQRFRQYQIEVLEKAKTNGLKWNDFYEIMALSSVIVLSSPCPYPAPIFTSREWQKIIRENPYAITDPVLPADVLSSLRSASVDRLKGKTNFLSIYDSEVGQAVSRIFNDICSSVPDVSPIETSEDEHCFQLLHPIIRPLFFTGSNKEYKIRLNRVTKGPTKRADFSCLVDEIPILNSEIKPPGFTPLQQQKDKLKVQLQGLESINQLLNMKGGPEEAMLLTNQGDLVESYVMDLKYDGLYRSWPFLTTQLVKNKATIPLLESNIRHFVALEERISKIAEDYNCRIYRSGITSPPLYLPYTRDLPNSPQIKKLL
ncbi:9950_t:CDS:10, partial [Acaulospora morrowiae]